MVRAVPTAVPARVLVVDDEPSIRVLLRVNLELDGHEVVEAASVAQAREALAGGVAVVVLDLNLRGERSVDLVAECHARRPPIPVLLVTGSVEIGSTRSLDADAVLPKPFEPTDLLATVRRLLEPQPV
jgi:DNA-binding NtrC family response regulator